MTTDIFETASKCLFENMLRFRDYEGARHSGLALLDTPDSIRLDDHEGAGFF